MTNQVDTDARFMEYEASKLMLPRIDITPDQMTPEEIQLESTKAMPQAYVEGVPQMISGIGKGAVTGIGGTPGELVGLVSGLLNAISPKDYQGQPHDPNKDRLTRFIEGYDAVPGKMEDINKFLSEQGWDVEGLGEPLQDIMEFIAPGALTAKNIKRVVKSVKGK